MKNAVQKALLLALALMASACTNTQRAPSMLDYSYVPPQYVGNTATPNYGIDDF